MVWARRFAGYKKEQICCFKIKKDSENYWKTKKSSANYLAGKPYPVDLQRFLIFNNLVEESVKIKKHGGSLQVMNCH